MSYLSTVLADSPAFLWRLNETGLTAADASGNGYTGTYTGGGFTRQTSGALVGDADTSATFNGTTSYIPGAAAISPNTGSFSFECWFFLTKAISSTGQYMVNDQNSTTGRYMYVRDLGIIFGFWDPVKLFGNSAVAPVPTLSVWHHVVGTFDGSTSNVYLDGVIGIPSITTPMTVQASTFPITAGRFASGSSNFFGGKLDEVAGYNYALTAQQVQDHYAAGQALGRFTGISSVTGIASLTF